MDMLDIKLPPEPEPEVEEKPTLVITETDEGEEELAPAGETEEPEKEYVPDEEVFKDAPQVKKVKRKPSEKQLAHLKKMREKKEANRRQKEEWLEEQKSKQNKFVKQERKQTRATRAKQPIIKQKVEYVDEPDIQHYDAGGGGQGEPINSRYAEEEEVYYEPQQPSMYQLSAEQIQQLQRNAIADYDTIRQQRQAKAREQIRLKQAEQRERQTQQQVFGQMRGATGNYDPNDPFANCFQ